MNMRGTLRTYGLSRTVGTLYCYTVGLQCTLQRTVHPLHFELGCDEDIVRWRKEQLQDWLDIIKLSPEQLGDTDIEPLKQLAESVRNQEQVETFKLQWLTEYRPLLKRFAECIV